MRWYLDIAMPSLAWGLAITRIGCFLNGCCWEAVCVDERDPARLRPALPWAVRFPYGSPAMVQQYKFGQLAIPKELLQTAPRGESSPLPKSSIDALLAGSGATSAELEARSAGSTKHRSAKRLRVWVGWSRNAAPAVEDLGAQGASSAMKRSISLRAWVHAPRTSSTMPAGAWVSGLRAAPRRTALLRRPASTSRSRFRLISREGRSSAKVRVVRLPSHRFQENARVPGPAGRNR